LASASLLAVSASTGALLLRQQRSQAHPFLPLDILRLPGVARICGTVVCFAACLFALVFLLPIYLQLGRGANASDAGWQMLPLTAGLVVGSTINARITVRTALPTRMPPYGLGASALALLVLAIAPASIGTIDAAAAIVGIGFGTVMPSAQLAIQTLAGRAKLGAAAALLSLTRSSGASVGTAAFSALMFALLRIAPGGVDSAAPLQIGTLSPAQVVHACQWAFASIALVVALGAWIASRVPQVHLLGSEARAAG